MQHSGCTREESSELHSREKLLNLTNPKLKSRQKRSNSIQCIMGPGRDKYIFGELYIPTKTSQSRTTQKEVLVIQELANNIPSIGNL